MYKISVLRKVKMGGDEIKKEMKEGKLLGEEDIVLTPNISQGVRALLVEEAEEEEGVGFTEEEEAVGAVGEEEEVEDTMVVEGEVSLVAAVSTGELSRYHFRESRKYYLVDWAGGLGFIQFST